MTKIMVNKNTLIILQEGERLFRSLNKIDRFRTRYYHLPLRETSRLIGKLRNLSASLSDVARPGTKDQLLLGELKRRTEGEATYLEQSLSGDSLDFDTVITTSGIPMEDINDLKPWLEENKERTLDSIERLFSASDIKDYELPLASDVPRIERMAEGVAEASIERYHRVFGKFLQRLTKVGDYLREISAGPIKLDRAYFNPITNRLGIPISGICFSKDDTPHLREKELIRLYGHEGMGHGLNTILTKNSDIPYVLQHFSQLITPTAESVAQFYEGVIFEDLKEALDVQEELGIRHIFPAIYQEVKDSEQADIYQRKLSSYAISVLADKNFGDPTDPSVMKEKMDVLNQVTLYRASIIDFVESHRYYFDSQGNLNPQLVRELRYCANPVQRALGEFEAQGLRYSGDSRNLIDRTFLTGFWTPIGFVDNARLEAEKSK